MTAARAAVSVYGVWVSEVMLQQTRVETVIEYYVKWVSRTSPAALCPTIVPSLHCTHRASHNFTVQMTRFPTVESLARARLSDVHYQWAGLGYYRRATLLHSAAEHVVTVLSGSIPRTVQGLLNIPGIGPYTAGAIASIALQQRAAAVDGNVIRVLSRLRAVDTSANDAAAVKLHWSLAAELVDDEQPGDWTQAVMELGATVCMPKVAECGRCPVREWCRAYQEVATKRRPCSAVFAVTQRVEVEVEPSSDDRIAGEAERKTAEVDHARPSRPLKRARSGKSRALAGRSGDAECDVCSANRTGSVLPRMTLPSSARCTRSLLRRGVCTAGRLCRCASTHRRR